MLDRLYGSNKLEVTDLGPSGGYDAPTPSHSGHNDSDSFSRLIDCETGAGRRSQRSSSPRLPLGLWPIRLPTAPHSLPMPRPVLLSVIRRVRPLRRSGILGRIFLGCIILRLSLTAAIPFQRTTTSRLKWLECQRSELGSTQIGLFGGHGRDHSFAVVTSKLSAAAHRGGSMRVCSDQIRQVFFP
jgi:hypothetical protein